MILYFENADKLLAGIKELSCELGFETGEKENADIVVCVSKINEDSVMVNLNGKEASITYGGQLIRFYRGLGLLAEAISEGKKVFSKKENPSFKINGSMFDFARKLPHRPKIIKEMLRKQAIMGLNTFMFYLEDMFEVPEYPYFGHMRGRYTKEEIRDMDKYAQVFGIELFPSIQTLGHFEQLLKWDAMTDFRDTINTIMLDDERTYDLIDRMMASIADSFSSKHLEVGMDEASMMGLGNYKYKNGLKPQFELFCRHIEKVKEIADKYGFEIMVSSDMFFKMMTGGHYTSDIQFTQEQLKLIPEGVKLCYWRYGIYTPEKDEKVFDAEENEKVLKIHQVMTDNLLYMGGVQSWVGPVILYLLSNYSAKNALEACIKNNVKEVLCSVWGDGGETPLVFAMYSLMLYAEMDYNGFYDEAQIKKRFKYIFRFNADDIIDLEKINFPEGRKNDKLPVEADYKKTAIALFYSDPILGLMDRHVADYDAHAFYTQMYEEFKDRGVDTGLFGPAFNYIKGILYILPLKADYGLRLKKAYDARDEKALEVLYNDAIELEKRYKNFRRTALNFHRFYAKNFGSEIIEIRLSAMASRFATVRYYLDKLKENPSYIIEELEDERLYMVPPDEKVVYNVVDYDFGRFYSSTGIARNLVVG